MARIAVISRSGALAMGMGMAGHDVVEVRLPEAAVWLAADGPAHMDALLLDLGEPHTTRRTVEDLRARGRGVRVLVAGGHDPGWETAFVADRPGCALVRLPASGQEVAAAMTDLLSRPEADPGSPEPTVPWTPPGVESPPSAGDAPPRRPNPPAEVVRRVAPGAADASVAALLAATDALYGVADTSTVVADEATRRLVADGAVVLVADDRWWRVGGAVGLRPLEEHVRLSPDDPILRAVRDSGRAVLIPPPSDGQRPGAGWSLSLTTHLAGAPVPGTEAVLLVGREHPGPFTADEVHLLGELATEASVVLTAAVDVRRLARALHRFEELPDDD